MNSENITNIDFKTIESLKSIGFEGFVPVADLWRDHSVIPNVKGVYMVVRTANTAPKFLNIGTGGFYKDKDPNISLDLLHAGWVDETCVVYIGQAGGMRNGKQSKSTLRKRLDLYLRFGRGESVAHWGGRCIWQLEDAANLLFCWKPLRADDPREVEAFLISSFKKCYGGRRPFANKQD